MNLSVNINKFATLRNARGGNNPDLIQVAKDCQLFGANGITVHPRPDERHIRYQDVYDLRKIVITEFNIEGNPTEQKFMDLVLDVKPDQVTLVPDGQGQLTSDHGWDTITHQDYLKETIAVFQQAGIRVSIFIDPVPTMIQHAATTGTDRVELYTESYAAHYSAHKENAIAPYISAAEAALACGLGLNAGHDLDLHNLSFFAQQIPAIHEVSIGHALVCDALYVGLQNTIQMYQRCLVTT
ncbi:MAG TPA: pyridoxine 5'-phosphate synthase [Chitinophagaceae bacterium]|nr:pyridoxine 5'-phosphate synthase [Chitinophagaceae bacterium]